MLVRRHLQRHSSASCTYNLLVTSSTRSHARVTPTFHIRLPSCRYRFRKINRRDMSVATRELVPYFIPSDGAPSVNETLAVFAAPPAMASANELPDLAARAAATASRPRVWDKSQGFFVPAQEPQSPPRKASSGNRSIATPENTSQKQPRRTHTTPRRTRPEQRPSPVSVQLRDPELANSPSGHISSPTAAAAKKQRRQRRTSRPKLDEQVISGNLTGTSQTSSGATQASAPEASPPRKLFAGCTFETASPEPHALPVPRFVKPPMAARTEQSLPQMEAVVAATAVAVAAATATQEVGALSRNEAAALDLRRMLRI